MGDRSLYDTDILAWSEQQAAALRALEGWRDLPNALDLPNLVEEIEALGRSELRAATSPIRLILEHLVKLASAPEAPARAHWVGEILHWHADMQASISPSMHRRIDMDLLWRRGRNLAEESLRLHGDTPLPGLPASCPLRLEDFLAEEFDWQGAVSRIAAASGH